MNVLVIGGSYFVGRAIAEHLIASGHSVCVLNRGSRKVAGARQLTADRDDPVEFMQGLGGRSFDWVVDTSCVTGQQARIARGILARRFGTWVHLSSAAFYIDDGHVPMAEDHPVGRSVQWGDYGQGKLDAETAHIEIAARDPAPVIVLRPPYVYGPGNEEAEREHWLWSRILRGRPVLVPGDGATGIQFIHCADLARAVEAAASASLPDAVSIFNVAHAEAPSFRAYVEALGRACGVPPDIVEVPWRELGLAPRDFFPFRDYPCVLDVARIGERLDWKPEFDLDLGLTTTFAASDRGTLESGPIDTAEEDRILSKLRKRST